MSDETRTFSCIRCGERLDPNKVVWLELNHVQGRYYPEGNVPENESQGGFEFGQTCAQRVLENGGVLERIKGIPQR